MTSGLLHSPSHNWTFIWLILKSLLKNGKFAMYVHKASVKRREREEQAKFSVFKG